MVFDSLATTNRAARSPAADELGCRKCRANPARSVSLGATVKPPNDIYVGAHKVAGVLLEMRAVPGPHLGILGIGINVNQSLEDFPRELQAKAASIAMLTGAPIDRHALAVALLARLDRTYAP